jgi:hypothetical protein
MNIIISNQLATDYRKQTIISMIKQHPVMKHTGITII